MRKLRKLFMSILLMFGLTAGLTSCGEVKTAAQATIGFKANGAHGDYSEAIEEFEIGKRFYTCVEVKIETDKTSETEFDVLITVPKTKDVVVDNRGGLDAVEVTEDTDNQVTVLKYLVRGKKGAQPQKMLFKGTPYNEGSATIRVEFYNHETNERLQDSFSMTVYFVYDIAQ